MLENVTIVHAVSEAICFELKQQINSVYRLCNYLHRFFLYIGIKEKGRHIWCE